MWCSGVLVINDFWNNCQSGFDSAIICTFSKYSKLVDFEIGFTRILFLLVNLTFYLIARHRDNDIFALAMLRRRVWKFIGSKREVNSCCKKVMSAESKFIVVIWYIWSERFMANSIYLSNWLWLLRISRRFDKNLEYKKDHLTVIFR